MNPVHSKHLYTDLQTKKHSYGLPTRSRVVSEFMIGLEKTKAKMGEVSQSARALSLEDMHRLYDACFDPKLTDGQKRWGAIRYVRFPCVHYALTLWDKCYSLLTS